MVQAAIRAFARKGYGGTTLADIAAEAGVSQPRISQIFGNKEGAFLRAQRAASGEILEVLTHHIAPPYRRSDLNAGYRPMMEKRPEILLMVFQTLTSAYVPSIGEAARRFVNEVVRIVTEEGGGTRADALDLLSRGVFINALLAVDAPEHAEHHPELAQLLDEVNLS